MKTLNEYINESQIDNQVDLLDKITEMDEKYGKDFMWAVRKGKGKKLALEFAKDRGADMETLQTWQDNYFEDDVIGFFYSNKASFDNIKNFRQVLSFKTDYKNPRGSRIYHSIWAILNRNWRY